MPTHPRSAKPASKPITRSEASAPIENATTVRARLRAARVAEAERKAMEIQQALAQHSKAMAEEASILASFAPEQAASPEVSNSKVNMQLLE